MPKWVFTVPKMLRGYFLHHREFLGALSLAAYETVKSSWRRRPWRRRAFGPG